MTTETIRGEIVRQFEDLRFLLSEGIRTGVKSGAVVD
jgi:hypothetical protein